MNNVTPLLLTSYERYGLVGMSEYIECFIDENLDVDEINYSDYNEYLAENRYYDDYIYSMDELDEYLYGLKASQVIDRINTNKFNYSHDFFVDTVYGIESIESSQVKSLIADNKDYLKWYIEKYDLIDEDEAQAIIDECNALIRKGY